MSDHVSQIDDMNDGKRCGATYVGSHSLQLIAAVEAIVFAAREPISIYEIMLLIGEEVHTKQVKAVLNCIQREYEMKQQRGEAGFVLREVGGGYQFQTIDDVSHFMQKMFSISSRSLSRAAQETLAIIAYRQPLTRADIEYIRGVDAGSMLKKLLEQDLICVIGRSDHVGKPLLFATTRKFLDIYHLSSLKDLPPIDSFQPSREDVRSGQKILENIPSMLESQEQLST